MKAGPGMRRLLLTTHVATSVGLLGAVGAFLSLAVAGLAAPQAGPAIYPAMDLITQAVIVPLALAGLLLGILQSLVTQWGLVRHYWVVTKLILTIIVAVVLFLQTGNIRALASLSTAELATAAMAGARFSMVLHAGGGLVVLLGITVLSIYKPRGLTRYGWSRAKTARPA